MSNATDIQKQLEEAWDGAEIGRPEAYDLVIILSNNVYSLGTAIDLDRDGVYPVRILERAPKPKPKPFAIVASATYLGADEREVFVPSETFPGEWESAQRMAVADHLVDPVPLVELPSHQELADAIYRGVIQRRFGTLGPRDHGEYEADAVLELLKGGA